MKQKRYFPLSIIIILLVSTIFASISGVQSQTGSQVANIDVFTNRGGIGPNVNSGSYGPQELVQMYANATYRNTAIVNQDVAFYVKNLVEQLSLSEWVVQTQLELPLHNIECLIPIQARTRQPSAFGPLPRRLTSHK